ncbi:MAG TPA: secretion system protein E [Opitutae bacterium]|nr:secretion system protein E [Opitutae bacterium]
MTQSPHVSKNLRRSLLLKIITKSTPTKEDVNSIIELTAGKVLDELHAQSMTLYLVDGTDIVFKYVYYSSSLWGENSAQEKRFEDRRQKLIGMRIPMGTGLVGEVIKKGQSNFFSVKDDIDGKLLNLSKNTDFAIQTMLTAPLKTDNRVIGAIQLLNKEEGFGENCFNIKDQTYLEEIAEYTSSLLLRILDPDYKIKEDDTARYISSFTETPLIVDEDQITVDENLLSGIDGEIVRKEYIFPFKRIGESSIAVLMKNPLDYQTREAFSLKTQFQIDEVYVAPASLIEHLIKKYFQKDIFSSENIERNVNISEITEIIDDQYEKLSAFDIDAAAAIEDENSTPIIQLSKRIIEDAYFSNASDIHIEPQDNRVQVRYRIDGICIEKLTLPPLVLAPLVARIKIMSDLDIAQKRLPQDGRIAFKKFTQKNINIDLRIATCPTLYGEKVVMRILDKNKSALPITALGFSEGNLKLYRECIRRPYGMILHCGPTGSGKSMTLFSALREVATPEINIQTAEDPIEYTIPNINQMQVHKAIGLTFASALRSFLRMDPDVILVGEIRDRETAEIAIESALTGHLLLSTVHTNDAPSTIARLTDMGIESFLVSSSLIAICAQRLIRRVCPRCREQYDPVSEEAEMLQKGIQWSGPIYRANPDGCPACGGTGMRGRIGIHELLINSPDLVSAINRNADTATLKKIAIENGLKTLHQDALIKVKEGMSTMAEVLAVAPPDLG